MTSMTQKLRSRVKLATSCALLVLATRTSQLEAQTPAPQPNKAEAAKPAPPAVQTKTQAGKPAAATATAQADAGKPAPAPTLTKAEAKAKFEAAVERMQSSSEDRFREGLETLTQIGGEPAAAAVIARLRRGLPPQLAELTIDALVKLKRPGAAPALLELLQHRRAQLRIKALSALSALEIRSAQSAVLYSLDDPSSEVRSSAARTLARIGNARALPALLAAAEHGVPGAWEAYGTLAQPSDLKQLFARAQSADVAEVRPALDLLLSRSNITTDAKLRLIAWVKERASASARTWLVDAVAALPAQTQPPAVRNALQSAVETIDREHPEFKAAATAAAEAAAGPKPSASLNKPRTSARRQVVARAPEHAP